MANDGTKRTNRYVPSNLTYSGRRDMKKVLMVLVLGFGLFYSTGVTDWTCMQYCLDAGINYSYCVSRCSY